MAEKRKYLQVGQVVQFQTKNGPLTKIELDNEKLNELITLLDKYYAENVEGLSVDDIRAAQKLKFNDPNRLNKIQFLLFDKHEKAPDFVLHNVVVNIDEF